MTVPPVETQKEESSLNALPGQSSDALYRICLSVPGKDATGHKRSRWDGVQHLRLGLEVPGL